MDSGARFMFPRENAPDHRAVSDHCWQKLLPYPQEGIAVNWCTTQVAHNPTPRAWTHPGTLGGGGGSAGEGSYLQSWPSPTLKDFNIFSKCNNQRETECLLLPKFLKLFSKGKKWNMQVCILQKSSTLNSWGSFHSGLQMHILISLETQGMLNDLHHNSLVSEFLSSGT